MANRTPSGRKNSFHAGRVNEEIMRELTGILRTVKDPRVSEAFISITRADTTADLKYSKVHYSLLSGDVAEVEKGLKSATGYIRRELASRLDLRMTPELTFVHDNSIEHGAHIAKLLSEVLPDESKKSDEKADN